MKAIRNTTKEPLRVPLGGGKILHLGPGQTGQIADDAVNARGVRQLIKSGAITVGGEDGRPGEFAESQGRTKDPAHGHVHKTKVLPTGNRGS